MFRRKEIRKPLPAEPPKQITLTEDQFIQLVIDYESGQIAEDEILILFCYIVENEKYERYLYPWLTELMNFGVITDEGLVNPQKLKEYKNAEK